MDGHLYRVAVMVVALLAVGRAVAIHVFWVTRLLAYSKRAIAMPTSWRDLPTYPEPPLLIVTTLLIWSGHANPREPAGLEMARVAVAARLGWATRAITICDTTTAIPIKITPTSRNESGLPLLRYLFSMAFVLGECDARTGNEEANHS